MDPSPAAAGLTPAPAPRTSRRRWAARGAALGVATVAGALVVTGAVEPPSATAAALRPFDDCRSVHDWYVEAYEPYLTQVGTWGGGYAVAEDVSGGASEEQSAVAPQGRDSAAGASGDGAVGDGATGTNLQEAGVDEPDTMKTRDGLLITTVGDRLVVVDVSGEKPRRLGEVEVPGLGEGYWGGIASSGAGVAVPEESVPGPSPEQAGTAELLLAGDRVVVLAHSWIPLAEDEGAGTGRDAAPGWTMPYQPGTATTVVTLVDVSDPADPTVVSRTETEGQYVSARLSGGSDGTVRLVTTAGIPAIPLPHFTPSRWNPDGTVDDEYTQGWLAEARAALADAAGEDFLPRRLVRDESGEVVSTTPALACSDLAHPVDQSGLGSITVTTLDPAADGDDPVVDTTGVSSDGDLVYAGADRLYVATTRGGWGMWGGDVAGGPSDITTALHGFDTTVDDSTTYVASGQVDGWLLGRWALSAQDGMLRVATTRDGGRGNPFGGGDPDTDSAVTVLAERSGTLEKVGEVTGLGKGEQIRAVRWFGDMATVVTFRQTDPLYVVDLSDPAAPTVTGELKIPGYSAYLHPVGGDLLLGVGQDATEDGRTTGMQVSTFDISDRAAPSRVDVLAQRDTWTAVEGDSRQFSYLPERRLALLPLQDPSGSAVQTLSVGNGGDLAVAATHRFGASDWVQRAMVTGDDAVVVLVSGEKGPRLAQLDIGTLSESGSLSL